MGSQHFDVVIVGARCAGSALAAFLARSGARVLAVDRDAFPSDQVLSTHTIHPPGVDILDELGVGDAVRSVTPLTRVARLRKNDAWADVSFLNGRAELCPRRKRLDGLLQEAAVEAGAELRDRTRAMRVLFDGEKAVGVEVRSGNTRDTIQADLVVGADGRRSFVADEVGAKEYMAYDAPRAMYWAYWNAPEAWRSTAYPFDMYLSHVGEGIRVIFQTDNDQLLIGSLPPADVARGWRSAPQDALAEDLSRDDIIGPLLSGAEPDSDVRGTVKERYHFREGVGIGWALVGDAGHHKEFVVGDGITEALIQAKTLAQAIGEGTSSSLVRWWRARDVEALSGYYWGRDEGALGSPMELECIVVEAVARSRRLQDLMTRLPEHQGSPYDALPVGVILQSLVGAVLRGRFRVLRDFMVLGRRVRDYKRTLRHRRRLLAEVTQ